jgi:hypothetical protein
VLVRRGIEYQAEEVVDGEGLLVILLGEREHKHE